MSGGNGLRLLRRRRDVNEVDRFRPLLAVLVCRLNGQANPASGDQVNLERIGDPGARYQRGKFDHMLVEDHPALGDRRWAVSRDFQAESLAWER